MLYNKQEKIDAAVGVIVGRFQVNELHDAHRELINHVRRNHPKVIIALGVTSKLGSRNNPLDFISRRQMIQESYMDVDIVAIHDNRSDHNWSRELDRRIREVSPTGGVIIYGGRDSFISHYDGAFRTQELESDAYYNFSGTEIRNQLAKKSTSSADFRAGVIYACSNRYPTGYPTVDVAIVHEGRLLLGRKLNEDKYRFIGGFFDPKSDTSLEMAARREASEETGGMSVEIDKYIGSFVVDDWRYRGERDKIITTFYQAKKLYGPSIPSDDIAELKWFDLTAIKADSIMYEHIPLMNAFLAANRLSYWTVEQNDISKVKLSLDGMNQG